LPGIGGAITRQAEGWQLCWPDGSESGPVCFDGRTAEQHPELTWLTLEDARARALISDLPRFVPGMTVPVLRVGGLPATVRGTWSLWEIRLSTPTSMRRRFLPAFVSEEGRSFAPTARRIWDLLLTESVDIVPSLPSRDASDLDASQVAADAQGAQLYADMVKEHRQRLTQERERLEQAFEARSQAIGRIGLPSVRQFRRKHLQAEHDEALRRLQEASSCSPELNAVLMVHIGAEAAP
jgi:hypothetical protein